MGVRGESVGVSMCECTSVCVSERCVRCFVGAKEAVPVAVAADVSLAALNAILGRQ